MPSGPTNRYDAFLRALSERLSAQPSTALNAHCVSEHTLYELFREIKAQGIRARDSHGELPHHKLLSWLVEIGVLKRVPVDGRCGEGDRRTSFYAFHLFSSPEREITPLDLLQAYHAEGVICYATAVALHGLSTQPPAHHHVALLAEPRAPREVPRSRRSPSTQRRPADPLGTSLFSYRGVRYYKTSRDSRLVPGIQTRYHRPTALIRTTTLEQTLLDTLHRPLNCGGPSVVFEAWESALPRISEPRFAEYLRAMDRPAIVQRVGYLLDALQYTPSSEVQCVLDACLAALNPDDPSAHQQLFPGIEYHNLKQRWLVYGP